MCMPRSIWLFFFPPSFYDRAFFRSFLVSVLIEAAIWGEMRVAFGACARHWAEKRRVGAVCVGKVWKKCSVDGMVHGVASVFLSSARAYAWTCLLWIKFFIFYQSRFQRSITNKNRFLVHVFLFSTLFFRSFFSPPFPPFSLLFCLLLFPLFPFHYLYFPPPRHFQSLTRIFIPN